jgi:ornithine cyclodeaminase
VPVLLTESDVRTVLTLPDLIEAMQAALIAFSAHRVQQPLRTVVEFGKEKSFFGVMPAFLPDAPALGTKLVTVVGTNPAVGLPSHLATIVLLDPATGALVALIDGRFVTEARTAAVSAVSTRLLARPEAGRLAIIGSGVQARSHLEAIACVRLLKEVKVWSPSADRRHRFVDEMRAHCSARLEAADSPHDAVANADIVVLATSARRPVVHSDWIKDGAHICAVGACRPDQREMDGALVARARLVVDSREGALAEAGDIVLAIEEHRFGPEHIVGELGELLAGTVEGRGRDTDVTLFKSLGMAVEDVAAAHLAFVRAKARGLGRVVEV